MSKLTPGSKKKSTFNKYLELFPGEAARTWGWSPTPI